MARAPAAALLALAALLASAAAQAPAAAAPPASAGDNQRWDAMMARIAGMQAACSPIKEKWQCNSGTDKCEWDEAQTPPCGVPAAYIRARLIESAPCPGSTMEGWFACNAANNNKGECLKMKGSCTWTDWSKYTSLPVSARRLMQGGPDAGPAEPGACQLTEVYDLRASEAWDKLSAMSFLVSHVDPQVWGKCSTVSNLQTLVPQSTRKLCSTAPTEAACAAAAPLCKWSRANRGAGRPDAGCRVTCETSDKAACGRYIEDCIWSDEKNACKLAGPSAPVPMTNAELAAAALASAPLAANIPSGLAARAAAPAPAAPAAGATGAKAGAAGRASAGKAGGGGAAGGVAGACEGAAAKDDISCAADSTIHGAAASLAELSENIFKLTKGASGTLLANSRPDQAGPAKSGASRAAGAAAAALAGAAALLL